MSGALSPITFVWHYVFARLVYDELVRPVVHGHLTAIIAICAVAGGGFLLGWTTGRARAARRRRT